MTFPTAIETTVDDTPADVDYARCQHCDGSVAWGQTEQGFPGFVHTASSTAACPA